MAGEGAVTGTASVLAQAVAGEDPWTSLERLAHDPPDDLLAVVRARYAEADSAERRRLTWLLRLLPGPAGAALMLDLLPDAAGTDAGDLLRELARLREPVPDAEIVRLLDDAEAREAALDAASHASLAPLIATHLDTPGVRGRAALALGRLRATAYTAEIVTRLPHLAGLEHGAFTVALRLMGDPAAIPPLRAWLLRAPADPAGLIWNLHHALVRLSAWEPVLPLDAGPAASVEAIRAAWAGRDLARPAPPRVTDVSRLDATRVRLTVRDGAGRIGIGYDPPAPGSPWPEWDRSLLFTGTPVYHVGSDCGTCETSLRLIGWPAEPAAALSERLRALVRDVPGVTAELVDAVAPLLGGLRSGHYLLTLADLDLQHVTEPEDAWWWRRIGLRESDDLFPDDDDPIAQWPGTDHFQLRDPIPGTPPAYGTVLPTRPLDDLSAETVAGFARDIDAGLRPAALLLSWSESRYIQAACEEGFLVNVILDGHHKLSAYARQGVPARVLLVCRVEDSWGPPEDRTRRLREMTDPLRAGS